MATTNQSRTAIVVGAGLGGLTAAIALAKLGWSVRVLEKYPEIRTEGSGIALNQNVQDMLNFLGALEDTLSGLPDLDTFLGRDGNGTLLGTIKWPLPIYFVERRQLALALTGAAHRAGVEIRFAHEVASASADGTVELRDGRSLTADLIVGADGVRSQVRANLGIKTKLHPLRFGGAVTLVPRNRNDWDVVGGNWTEYWRGTRHVYTAPVGNDLTYIAFFANRWKGLRAHRKALRTGDLSPVFAPIDVIEWSGRFHCIASTLCRVSQVPLWTRFIEVRLQQWSRGQVGIIGDAAHAMAPALGAGGATAMMDAISLAAFVTEAESVEDGLKAWEARTRPFIDSLQRRSRRWGSLFQLPSFVQRAVLFNAVKRNSWLRRRRFEHIDYRPPGLPSGPAIPKAA